MFDVDSDRQMRSDDPDSWEEINLDLELERPDSSDMPPRPFVMVRSQMMRKANPHDSGFVINGGVMLKGVVCVMPGVLSPST